MTREDIEAAFARVRSVISPCAPDPDTCHSVLDRVVEEVAQTIHKQSELPLFKARFVVRLYARVSDGGFRIEVNTEQLLAHLQRTFV